jgi:hypothetical protein
MCSANQIKLVGLEKIRNNVDSKEVADSPLTVSPSLHILDGIRPE